MGLPVPFGCGSDIWVAPHPTPNPPDAHTSPSHTETCFFPKQMCRCQSGDDRSCDLISHWARRDPGSQCIVGVFGFNVGVVVLIPPEQPIVCVWGGIVVLCVTPFASLPLAVCVCECACMRACVWHCCSLCSTLCFSTIGCVCVYVFVCPGVPNERAVQIRAGMLIALGWAPMPRLLCTLHWLFEAMGLVRIACAQSSDKAPLLAG